MDIHERHAASISRDRAVIDRCCQRSTNAASLILEQDRCPVVINNQSLINQPLIGTRSRCQAADRAAADCSVVLQLRVCDHQHQVICRVNRISRGTGDPQSVVRGLSITRRLDSGPVGREIHPVQSHGARIVQDGTCCRILDCSTRSVSTGSIDRKQTRVLNQANPEWTTVG